MNEDRKKRGLANGKFFTAVAICALFLGSGNVMAAQTASNDSQGVQEQMQSISVTVTVVDTKGEPIIGANVIEKGTTNGGITDLDGVSKLNVKPGAILQVSFVGYTTQEVKATSVMKVVLKDDTELLDEVVVVGYGVQKKANLTGAVATVNAKALESRPVSSVSAAIAGQMPGVTAIQSSGAPGSQAADITIRGKNSINAASPLVIVDGVPGSMNTIDPNDIETFTVLKDAASAAIYGVQAANGVILITTKQGKKGEKTRVTYSGNVSWSSPVAKRELVNAYEYAVLYNEATLNENPNATLMFSPEEIEDYRT